LLLFREQGTERKIEALSLKNYLFLTAEGSHPQAPALKAGERVTFAGGLL
jgi:hypothetical protein